MINHWDKFFDEKITKILTEKESVIDIGGGLRLIKEKNNRYDPSREKFRQYLKKIDYKILDPVETFSPDIIGDVHNLPFQEGSQDAIICIAVLEHVENPIKAFEGIYRVLKPGGYAFIYVPFLYYYHAEKGYYGDFWRFTEDGLRWLSKPFSSIELVNVRGAISTFVHLTPIGRFVFFQKMSNMLDGIFGKVSSKQTSGYNLF